VQITAGNAHELTMSRPPTPRLEPLLPQCDSDHWRFPRILRLYRNLADRQVRLTGEDVDPVPHAVGRVALAEVCGPRPLGCGTARSISRGMTTPLTITPAMARRVEIWQTDRLVPYAKNARTHSPEQIAQIAASIVEFGFVNPILVDTSAGIVAAHGRLLAARKLGLAEVPVVVLDHLSETQRRAYIIADNKLALNAGWDERVPPAELRALEGEVVGRWHDNRHTLVTELAESGAGDEVIMSIAGHVSRTMLSRYSHVRMEAKRRALDEIAARQRASDEKRLEAERRL